MTTTDRKPTLVLGATGKTGRRVAARLSERRVPVRAGSRAADPPFAWEDRATWEPVLDGVGAMYVAYAPDLAVPGAAEAVEALAGTAVAAGVERIVLLSGRGEAGAQEAERRVRAVAPLTTVVRCAWFAQNFDEGYLRDGVLAGEVVLPVGGVREPFLDAEDIADVAVAALTQDGHGGEVYELTGPRLLSFTEVTAEIAAALGRPVAFVSAGLPEYLQALRSAGLPDDVTWLMGHLFSEVLDGRNALLADGVQRALGRPGRDLRDWARAAAAAGAWKENGR